MPSYSAIRTDPNVPAYFAAELLAGRLRQGWGHEPNQNLRTIWELPRPDRDQQQRAAWRGNRRLLEDAWEGLQVGDIVVLPNVPEYGCWSFARITGPYRYEIDETHGDYGHIRDAQPLRATDGGLAWIAPQHALVPAGMRRSMTCRSRMWSLDAYGDAIDKIVAALGAGRSLSEEQTPDGKVEAMVVAMRKQVFELVEHGWGAAELEDLVVRVLRHRYRATHPNARVEGVGGPAENGIDVLVTLPDPVGVALKIGVQVKKHDGVEHNTYSLDQIERARAHWGIHAGLVLTTATDVSEEYEAERAERSEKLGIDIQVLCRDAFVDLVLEHVAAEAPGRAG